MELARAQDIAAHALRRGWSNPRCPKCSATERDGRCPACGGIGYVLAVSGRIGSISYQQYSAMHMERVAVVPLGLADVHHEAANRAKARSAREQRFAVIRELALAGDASESGGGKDDQL